MTYLDLEFGDESLARAAIANLRIMDVTGEWHLAPAPAAPKWRLSLSSERQLSQEEITRLGGTPPESTDAAAPQTPLVDAAVPSNDPSGTDGSSDPLGSPVPD